MDDQDDHDKDMDHGKPMMPDDKPMMPDDKPMMPGDKDEDNEIDDEMKMAGVDKESVAKE